MTGHGTNGNGKASPKRPAVAEAAPNGGGAAPTGAAAPGVPPGAAPAPVGEATPAAEEAETVSGEGTGGTRDWSDKRIFTTGEAAEICKVSQQTIIRCFDAGRLGGFRVPGSKFRRIPRADLIRFMKENDIPLDAIEQGYKRILVVDDDKAILEMFRDLLGTHERFQVRTCSTGYDAGLLTESFRPHLIVLDYMLPDINGNVVCQRLRERDDLKGTKVIFVSGVVDQGEVDKLLAAGGDAFVRKPFDVHQFMERVKGLLNV